MNKNKHDHKATKKLKVFLFALFMILPFLVWIPNAFYYGFNAQAQASERIEQQPIYYQSNEVSTIDDLSLDKVYRWNDNYTATTFPAANQLLFYVKYTKNLTFIDTEKEVSFIRFYAIPDGRVSMYTRYEDNTELWHQIQNEVWDIVIDSYGTNFNFTSNLIGSFSKSEILIVQTYENIIYTNSITDSMSVAWQQTWSNPLFSWNNSNPLLEPLTNFTNVFGITTDSCIPQALCYLATITMIYIVFDIIIELFTKLTHLINRSD